MHSCDKFSLSWLVFNMLYLMSAITTESSTGDFKTFSDNNGTSEFNHLVVDRDRGWVFLSAVNLLYQLFPNLTLKNSFSTKSDPKATNYNKILVLDYNSSRLIACGSYKQGLCHVYKINDSFHQKNMSMYSMMKPILANCPDASTVAFVAPNPFIQKQKDRRLNSPSALYVGVTYSNSSIPAVATRSLKKENLLDSIKPGSKHASSTEIFIRNEFIINYVYGFSSESYVYFLTTQMNSTEPSPYVSKLIRICQQDEHYNSYTEIPIECTDENGTVYNLVQAASVTTPSSELAKSLGITAQDEVLFGIFAQSKQSVGHESNKPVNKSALCIYSLELITDKFTENIQDCNKGNGYRGLEYIMTSPEKCQNQPDDPYFRGVTNNLPLGGHLPARATSVISFDTRLTSVTAISKSDFTFVITGTHTGRLKQIVVKNATGVWECNDIVIDDGSPINPDTQFDSNGYSLYVMTEHKLTKINVSHLLPSILHVSPDKGPWEGGTNITIQVENFGKSLEGLELDIKVAGIPCTLHQNQRNLSNEIACVTNKSGASKQLHGLVEVKVNGIPATSQNKFTFVDPIIFNISVKESTTFNNTELIIEGKNLNVGNSVGVFIRNTACPVIHHDSQIISCVTKILGTIKEDDVIVKIDESTRIFNHPFNYIKDSDRDAKGYNLLPKGIPGGGVAILIRNESLSYGQKLIFRVSYENRTYEYNLPCKMEQNFSICFSPYIPDIDSSSINAENPKVLNYSLLTYNEMGMEINLNTKNNTNFFLYPNPIFEYFSINHTNTGVRFEIKGQYINNACQKVDFKVLVQNETCEVDYLSPTQLMCRLLESQTLEFENKSNYQNNVSVIYENITVQVGNFSKIVYKKNDTKTFTVKEGELSMINFLYIGMFGGFIVIIIVIFSFIALCLVYRKKYSESSKKMQERMNKLELRVATECKEAFAELQTETDLTTGCLVDGLPFLDYDAYVMKNLFLNVENHSSFLNESRISIVRSDRLKLLDNLIKNKTFLLIFIRTLESNEHFSMNNRVSIASILMITLHNNMDYCTDILETLMVDLIEKYTKGKSHPKLLLRRTESVVEKMISIWFTFLLYKFLRECAGKPLFILFMAIKQHINKGPVDMITSEARYSLNQEKLIRQHVDYRLITVFVNVSQQTAIIIGLKSAMEMVSVTVLDCDTITQVKEKALNIIFRAKGYSRYPKVSELELKWMTSALEGKMLYDSDSSSRIVGEWKQINTLRHYGVPDGTKLNLLSSKQVHRRTSSVTSDDVKKSNCYTLQKPFSIKQQRSDESTCSLIRNKEAHTFKEWHLVESYSNSDCGCTDSNEDCKMISEIYLTRLLATKLTMQRFVDDLFKVILIKSNQNHCFPTAIKYMFDFLDDQAAQCGITDPEVVHIWKNNCLPLRFWVNLIKNPDFLFDIHKSNIIDSCLSVIAQAFMDSCSTADQNLGKDSPTSKLLFAKDIPHYKKLVRKYYAEIKAMPAISRKYAKIMFAKELLPHANDFNTNASICELYKYMRMYKKELIAALREDPVSQKDSLANNFEEVIKMMSIA